MLPASSDSEVEVLQARVKDLIEQFPNLKHQKWIQRSLSTLLQMAGEDWEALDWKIVASSLQDLRRGCEVFYPYRHIRKIAVFGSSRISNDTSEYQLAVNFAHCVTAAGFMVLTGAGAGVMAAANQGAGAKQSFGLNIQLPFADQTNDFIAGDPKLIHFKYFFTRKLFFLRESDAIALFPGGFGTLDEAFETLTLMQTGKFDPAPLVLIDKPGGHYWHDWENFVQTQLLRRGLISADDLSFYQITDNLEVACQIITDFYRVYHSSRYVKDQFVLRLKSELSDAEVAQLNTDFPDLLSQGKIEKSLALPAEQGDETEQFPRLIFNFNRKNFGRLYQLIRQINQLGVTSEATLHPEQK